MDKDLEQLVSATRRLGRSRPNRRLAGTAGRRRRGEKLLRTIRQSGGIPQPKLIIPRQLGETRKDDGDGSDSSENVFADIAGFAHKMSDTLFSAASEPAAKNRVFTPFPGASCELIRRSAKRRRNPQWPATDETAETPIEDGEARGLAAAGVLVLALAVIGIVLMVSSHSGSRKAGAISPMAEAEPHPQTENTTDATEGGPAGREVVLTGSAEPE